MNTKIRGFIFDIDGTLLDSNDAHAECLKQAFQHAGFNFDFSTLRKLIGMGFDQIMPKLTGLESESEQGKAVSETKDKLFAKIFPEIKVFAGSKELIRELHQQKFKVGIATSASKNDLKKFIGKLEIGEYLDESVTADDAETSKPEPDLVLAALKRLKLDPSEAVMVGDTPYDLEAAKKANVSSIAFRSGGWTDPDLTEAFAVLDGSHALLRQYSEILSRMTSA